MATPIELHTHKLSRKEVAFFSQTKWCFKSFPKGCKLGKKCRKARQVVLVFKVFLKRRSGCLGRCNSRERWETFLSSRKERKKRAPSSSFSQQWGHLCIQCIFLDFSGAFVGLLINRKKKEGDEKCHVDFSTGSKKSWARANRKFLNW